MFKKYFKIIVVLFIVVLINGCALIPFIQDILSLLSQITDAFTYNSSYTVASNELMINYNINFGGDWTFFKSDVSGDLSIDIDLINRSDKTPPFRKKYEINYEGNNPVLKYYDDYNGFILKSLSSDPYSDLTTCSIISKNGANYLEFKKNYRLENGRKHTIKLNYNSNSTSEINLTVDDVVNTDAIVSGRFEYNKVKVEAIQYKGDYKKSLNIVVMCDYVREDEMDFYREQVNDAFSPSSKFFTNNIGNYFKDRINILRYDTVSLDHKKGRTMLLTNNGGGTTHPNFMRVIKVINSANYGTLPRIAVQDVDAIIVFLNSEMRIFFQKQNKAFCDFPRPFQIRANMQPTNVVMIGNIDENGLKGNFNIDSIIHELGHGIGQLDDEYVNEGLTWFEKEVVKAVYNENYIKLKSRNLDTRKDENLVKWKRFIDLGYGDKSVVNEKLIIGAHQGGGYLAEDYIYRAGFHGLMNGDMDRLVSGKKDRNNNFDPVCAYHMMASIKTRIGDLPAYDLKRDFNTFNDYEWETYKIEEFKEDLSPDAFQ